MQDSNEKVLIDVWASNVRDWLVQHWITVVKYVALIAFVLAILVNLSIHHIEM